MVDIKSKKAVKSLFIKLAKINGADELVYSTFEKSVAGYYFPTFYVSTCHNTAEVMRRALGRIVCLESDELYKKIYAKIGELYPNILDWQKRARTIALFKAYRAVHHDRDFDKALKSGYAEIRMRELVDKYNDYIISNTNKDRYSVVRKLSEPRVLKILEKATKIGKLHIDDTGIGRYKKTALARGVTEFHNNGQRYSESSMRVVIPCYEYVLQHYNEYEDEEISAYYA